MINLYNYIDTLPEERQKQIRALADELIKALDDDEVSMHHIFIDPLASYRDIDDDCYDDRDF